MVQILETTLREGEQTPGLSFPLHVKLEIADFLAELNPEIIEVGHPIVSKNIYQAVKQISNRGMTAEIGAHSRSLEKDVDSALECGADFLGIFYCVSNDRLNSVFQSDLPKAIKQITKVIAYAKKHNPNLRIRYTPEDTVRSKFENVIKASVAAVEAGADIISVADTTGYMIPRKEERDMYDFVLRFRDELSKKGADPIIAIHCHNDRGFALANAIGGYQAGAEIIDASVLGLGERAGIADLATLMAVLHQDFKEKNDWNLKMLTGLYSLVSKYSGIEIPVNFPVTGKNAFTHGAGIHSHAAMIDPGHYQSLSPEPFGRETHIALDHMSGISSIRWALEKVGIENIDKGLVSSVLEQVKTVGESGRTVDLSEIPYMVEAYKANEQ